MNLFIQNNLKLSHYEATKIIGQKDDIDVIETIIGWANKPNERKVSAIVFYAILPIFQLERYKLMLGLNWYKCCESYFFINNATLFEFDLTFKYNPFYPHFAFNIPYNACLSLITQFQLKPSNKILMYGKIANEIELNGRCSSTLTEDDISTLSLCTKEMPLQSYNTAHISPIHLIKKLKKIDCVESILRINTHAKNNLVLKDGYYKFKTEADLFVDEILNLCK